MSWRCRLAVLRRVVPLLLPTTRTGTSAAVVLRGARCASRLSAPSRPPTFNVKDIFREALNVGGSQPGNMSPADAWADRSDHQKLPPPPDAWTGRRLTVQDGDLQHAFRQLSQRLRQNQVAREITLTVRHEKKGDKRARLRSERWRKRFADAVRKKVQLVSTIRRRGG